MRLSRGVKPDLEVSTLWDAFGRLKFDAFTVSSEDLPDVATIPAAAKAALVCANVTTADGKPIAPPVLYKQVGGAKKVRVAVVGLLGDPPYGTLPNPANSPVDSPWRVTDPGAALRKVMPEARKKSDVLVVLYSGTRDPARELIRTNPGIDVMVVGLEGSVDRTVEKLNGTAIVQNADRGRYAGELAVTLDKTLLRPTAFDMRSVPLDDAVPDDPDMAEMVKQFQRRLTGPSQQQVITQPIAQKSEWAGSFVCRSCHTQEFNQWQQTKHYIAFNTLERKDDGAPARRADCVKCHVVAFEKPGGFSLAQPRWDLKGVGCESCHGPGAAHVEARLKNTQDLSRMVRKPGKEVCMTCHTPENSPKFDFDKYLPHVVHSAHAQAVPAAATKADHS